MGLAISQVRLLALTTRKADIEQRMQINAKRKQMLTRKATDLSQQYYNRMHCAHYQYATSNGYEDIDYSYLMGKTTSTGKYSYNFLNQLISLDSKDTDVPQKTQNNMILTDQFGQVIVNDQMAEIIERVTQTYANTSKSTYDKATYALVELIKENKDNGLGQIYKQLLSADGSETGDIDQSKMDTLFKILRNLTLNEGAFWGGDIYTKDNSTFYGSLLGAQQGSETDRVFPKVGYMYNILDANNNGICYSNNKNVIYDENGSASGLDGLFNRTNANLYSKNLMSRLANLVSYFTPIITAAIVNGTSAKVNIYSNDTEVGHCMNMSELDAYFYGKPDGAAAVLYNGNNVNGYYVKQGGVVQKVESTAGSISMIGNDKTHQVTFNEPPSQAQLKTILTNVGDYYAYQDPTTGETIYYYCEKTSSDGSGIIKYDQSNAGEKFYKNYKFVTDDNSKYMTALNTESLQAGLRTGSFQLCMVDDPARGSYHKNTTMTYFTHMNYVLEKADQTQKEEITAWFNAENAAISEQETYWDAEVQNLSTELSEVKTEIESVKKLKSDSIKSVFNWGGN